MAMHVKMLPLVKWSAIIMGLAASLFFLFFIIGEGVWQLMEGRTGVIPVMVLVVAAVTGYFIALFRPWAGGLLMVISSIIMAVYFLVVGSKGIILMTSVYSLPFLIPGVLFMRFRKGLR
jgi:hypothetical protein